MREHGAQGPVPPILRALRLRCPGCGRGRMFTLRLRALPACEACGLKFDRGQHDHFLGVYTLNLIFALVFSAGGLGLGVWLTWPDVPWTLLQFGLAGALVALPFLTYPFSKSLWLAIDLVFRPAEPPDFEAHGGLE